MEMSRERKVIGRLEAGEVQGIGADMVKYRLYRIEKALVKPSPAYKEYTRLLW